MASFRSAFVSVLAALILIGSSAAEVVAPTEIAATAAARSEWTILVFLNANNDLDPFSFLNLNEMEMVGSTDQVNVVVQVTHRNAKKTLRYLMKKDSDKKTVTSPVVETMAKQDMGSHATLSAFIEWGMTKYPAKRYMVDIWNHGSGWEKKMSAGIVRGISYDDSTGHHITTPELGRVMQAAASKQGSKIELIGFDACLMQMAEVASEVSESTRFQVASEEVEPGQGWPYAEWLTWVVAHPDADGAGVGKALVETFRTSYSGGSHGTEMTTLSIIDLEKIDAMSKAADAFAEAVLADKNHRAQLVAGIQASQAYSDPTHHDVFDLVDQVLKRIPDAAVKKAGAALNSAASAVVLASAKTGAGVARSGGIAIWAPTSGGADQLAAYEELRWSRKGQWDELVAALASGNDRDLLRAMNARALFGE